MHWFETLVRKHYAHFLKPTQVKYPQYDIVLSDQKMSSTLMGLLQTHYSCPRNMELCLFFGTFNACCS